MGFAVRILIQTPFVALGLPQIDCLLDPRLHAQLASKSFHVDVHVAIDSCKVPQVCLSGDGLFRRTVR